MQEPPPEDLKKYSSFYHIIKQFRQEYYDSLSTEGLWADLRGNGFDQLYSLIPEQELLDQTKPFLKVEELSQSENAFQEKPQTFPEFDHAHQL